MTTLGPQDAASVFSVTVPAGGAAVCVVTCNDGCERGPGP